MLNHKMSNSLNVDFFMVIFCIFSRGKSNKDMLSENDVFLQGVSYPPPLNLP